MNNVFVKVNMSQDQHCDMKDCEGSSSNENLKFFRFQRNYVQYSKCDDLC
jgi:hypothetical protein